ncbi:MAG TPA: GNAT family N-acetyltransferase, partial [Burkholderiaceae bacterium]|nr:GNAT family N-acetyltransferase [Burkholderiaceae bacterium]
MNALHHFPELATARLQLREIAPSDASALFAIHSDADNMRWYGVDPVATLADASRLTELFASWFFAGTGYRWGIERREDKQLIGTCGLFRWNRNWSNCVTGYELGRNYQKQG